MTDPGRSASSMSACHLASERGTGGRADREKDRVAVLASRNGDGLVDERAEHLTALRQRPDRLGERAAAHRREDLDDALRSEIRAFCEEAQVLAVDKDVHERTECALAKHPRGELGVTLGDLCGQRGEIGCIEGKRGLAAGRGSERRGEPHGKTHPRTPAYADRNSSESASMTSVSLGVAKLPL